MVQHKEAGLSFNLTDQLVFYGSYHSNKWNQLIHFFFVPMIWFSAIVWMCYTGELLQNPFASYIGAGLQGYFVINGAFIVFLGYAVYYLTLSPLVGLSYDIVLFALYLGANWMYQTLGKEYAWKYALGLHVLGWYMQIHPGHILLEKRRAALIDSFFQSLILAPLFVWYEFLFFLGFFPEFQHDLKNRIGKNILEYRKSLKTQKTK